MPAQFPDRAIELAFSMLEKPDQRARSDVIAALAELDGHELLLP
jgi:hypothetical protein